MKSSVTSQKYSCPGREQNQLIHVSVDVGVEEAAVESIVSLISVGEVAEMVYSRVAAGQQQLANDDGDGKTAHYIHLPAPLLP